MLYFLKNPCYDWDMAKRGGKKCRISGQSLRRWFARWCDEWKLALSGVILATRNRRFLVAALLSFVFFGTLMNLLAGSTAGVDLFWVTDWHGKLAILGSAFLSIFGVGRSFWDWCLLFFVTILQSVLIGLVALVWQKRRRSKKDQLVATASNADNVQNAGIAAGLAILGSGCPTCGTTLLMPLLGTLFSASSYALASVISNLLTLAAVIVALWSLKKTGKDAYALLVSEKYMRRRQASKEQDNNRDNGKNTRSRNE